MFIKYFINTVLERFLKRYKNLIVRSDKLTGNPFFIFYTYYTCYISIKFINL
jgi:hypothetical protein